MAAATNAASRTRIQIAEVLQDPHQVGIRQGLSY